VNASKLRISLAIITIAGAYHLDSARAAEPARQGDCHVFAVAYATSVCESKGGRPSSVTYTCEFGEPGTILSVTCVYPT
jgi:hypothetical protein